MVFFFHRHKYAHKKCLMSMRDVVKTAWWISRWASDDWSVRMLVNLTYIHIWYLRCWSFPPKPIDVPAKLERFLGFWIELNCSRSGCLIVLLTGADQRLSFSMLCSLFVWENIRVYSRLIDTFCVLFFRIFFYEISLGIILFLLQCQRSLRK